MKKLLWKCVLVGADGSMKSYNLLPIELNEGFIDKSGAVEAAKYTSKFLDWPIIDLERVVDFDELPRD